jgi:sugar/nucleoside kinase (ribokinase family)
VPRFLSIGHIARDEFPDGAHRLGGTALYAAATAARLGVPTTLVTRAGPHERDELARTCADLDVDLRALDANVTTTFGFRWDQSGKRILRLKARAKAIGLADIPADLRSADRPGGTPDALVFGTIARELSPDLLEGETARVSVLAAQGMLRAWDADGTIRPVEWPDAERTIRALSAVVLSEDDVAGDTRPVERWSTVTPVVLTLAERGCRLYEGGHPTAELPAYPPARMVDTTGAGDTFAAGLAVALGEGRALSEACRFANAVASFGLEGPGIAALATRDAVERRLAG